jgi:glycosyltransferase involved in cell wall biosynthesis
VKTISVCTPTWRRPNLLFGRCIPSIQAQDYEGRVEHVIVSDGPDPELASWFEGSILASTPRYAELPEHPAGPSYGHYARMRAIELATGEYVAYLDDDDAFRPGHCRLLAAALDANPDAGFAVSQMLQHQFPPGKVMDWEIVERWLGAGVRGVAVNEMTVDAWPSMFR